MGKLSLSLEETLLSCLPAANQVRCPSAVWEVNDPLGGCADWESQSLLWACFPQRDILGP